MRRLIIIISVIALIVSSIIIIDYLISSSKSKYTYREISSIYNKDKNLMEDENSIEKLKDINEDIMGWISIPGTNIDYPVVQGKDNDYYLDRDVYGNSSRHGSIFMDYRNNISKDKNIIIYGHHMRDGTMFGELRNYKDETYYKRNRYIYLDIGKGKYKYRVFAVYITGGSTDYLKTNFKSTNEFLSYLETINKKSLFKEEHKFGGQEKLITLSTCSYEYRDARMVIHGYLVLH
ncbi:MAG TPA: class B sortase [Tepidimicrobium sp.]|nr:class B sortase [Tepidimicrobium sp.]